MAGTSTDSKGFVSVVPTWCANETRPYHVQQWVDSYSVSGVAHDEQLGLRSDKQSTCLCLIIRSENPVGSEVPSTKFKISRKISAGVVYSYLGASILRFTLMWFREKFRCKPSCCCSVFGEFRHEHAVLLFSTPNRYA